MSSSSSYTGTSFADAIKLQKLDDRTFRATLDPTFAIGNVPNGGYSSACVLVAAGAYLEARDQADTMTVHFEFVSTTKVGPAIITVEDVKLGRQLSTLHLTLWQGRGVLDQAPWVTPAVTKRAILAYATQTNLATFTGETLPMGFQYLDARTRPPKPDLVSLLGDKGGDGNNKDWRESLTPKPVRSLLKANHTWRYFVPRRKPFAPGVLDMWMTPRNGEPITQAMLPYVVDSFPFDMHMFLMDPHVRDLLLSGDAVGKTKGGADRNKNSNKNDSINNSSSSSSSSEQAERKKRKEREDLVRRNKNKGNLWFPTVVMNLENKTLLPKSGVRWLNVRITTKLMDNGKFDLDILVRDEDGHTIALSHHVALIVSMDRNVGGGGGGTDSGGTGGDGGTPQNTTKSVDGRKKKIKASL